MSSRYVIMIIVVSNWIAVFKIIWIMHIESLIYRGLYFGFRRSEDFIHLKLSSENDYFFIITN